ncbi:MAG: glycoside hydrolase family 78 protein [Treponema sp.]|nr:glycoside hydrolase family 78 protein [Treponema sp.]
MLTITELKTEYRSNPLGIDLARPRFSWILESDKQDTVQESYSITVTGPEGVVWECSPAGLGGSDSIHIEYAGQDLAPRTRYTVTLRLRDNHGEAATAAGWFETGLLGYQGFESHWITHGFKGDAELCPVFYRDFGQRGPVKAARVYASALGVYELRVNGKKAGNSVMAPGWTNYKKRIQYQTYDITELLQGSSNRIEITAAKGWYAGEFGFTGSKGHYGNRVAVIAQMHLDYEDGSSEVIATGEDWSYTEGPRRYAEIYHGEIIDHSFAAVVSGKAVLYEHPKDTLIAQECEGVAITERVRAKELIITPKGEVVLDFGQNLTGVVEARLNCKRRTRLTIKHAEILDKDGNFYTENLRTARATDVFICGGNGDEVFMPAFTFHGFRYIKIEGLEDKPGLGSFTACVLHTNMERTGRFECSHQKVNRLQQNILWSQRDNFLDISTDCPQRNERLGWTGDAQIFASTAAYNMNTALFFTKWLRDLASEQTVEQGVPRVIPNILNSGDVSAAWSDAATIIPWAMYQAFGDRRLLEEQYDSMKAWVEYIRSKATNDGLWQSGFQYGDWLGLDREEASCGDKRGATDPYFIASAYYAYSTGLVAKAAKALGKAGEAAVYEKLHRDIVAAFRREYISETGRLVCETQTACVLALYFNLAAEEHRKRILQILVENLARHSSHLVTGFVGTPYLCHTLSENGLHEIAGKVFLQEDYPGWLNCVNLGATTIWERWNSLHADGSVDDSGMNSFNHYAYGSIGSWMYQKLAGLEAEEPGYRKSRIAPEPVKGITWVDAGLKTMYGELACKWVWTDRKFTVDLTIPVNTTATVILPGKGGEFSLGSGQYHYEYPTDMWLSSDRYGEHIKVEPD